MPIFFRKGCSQGVVMSTTVVHSGSLSCWGTDPLASGGGGSHIPASRLSINFF